MDDLNIHIVISEATIPYCRYLIANTRHTADFPDRVRFYCYALDKESWQAFSNVSYVESVFPVYKHFWAYRKKTLREWGVFLKWLILKRPSLAGSNGHAAGLTGVSKTISQLGGHHIIADADTAMLLKGWDTKTCQLLEEYDLIGASYEAIGGFTSGNGMIQTYKDFPMAIWVALKEGLPWEEVNWWPEKETHIPIASEELSKIYSLPQGYELVRDVGWELCSFAYERKMKSLAFVHIKPTSDEALIIKTGADYNDEFQLNGVAWVGHQRGSSRNPFKETELSINFFDAVEKAVGVPPSLEGC